MARRLHRLAAEDMPLKRRKPLDEGKDTGTDLLERELERGIKIDTSRRPARARRDSAARRRGHLLVAKEHVTTRKKLR
jgi:hypothetical protein